jgi:hypothetical protein
MKNKTHRVILVATLLALALAACDPGPACDDPALVAIPGADDTPPLLTWMVTQASETPDGPISSIGPYTGDNITLNVKPTDQVKVYLVARDEESGVKQVNMSGGFGQTCQTPGGAIAASGILPNLSQDLGFLTVCGIIEWRLPDIDIDVGMSCVPDNGVLTQLGFGLNGSAENHKGGTATSTLQIVVDLE